MSVQLQIAFLISLFAAGFIARRRGWLLPAHAGSMLKLVMTVGLPALLLASVSRIPLHRDLLALPLAAVMVMLVTMAIAALIGRGLGLPRASHGAFLICSMSINTSFVFPFVLAAWGQEAFSQLALFDLGNAILQATVIYGVAALYGGHATGAVAILKRVLSFPPLWALAAALAINLGGGHPVRREAAALRPGGGRTGAAHRPGLRAGAGLRTAAGPHGPDARGGLAGECGADWLQRRGHCQPGVPGPGPGGQRGLTVCAARAGLRTAGALAATPALSADRS
jgi:predicted permease